MLLAQPVLPSGRFEPVQVLRHRGAESHRGLALQRYRRTRNGDVLSERMTMAIVELLVAGSIVVVVALLTRLAWVTAHRRERRGSITEVQTCENPALLTKAVLGSKRRQRTDLCTPVRIAAYK